MAETNLFHYSITRREGGGRERERERETDRQTDRRTDRYITWFGYGSILGYQEPNR